MSNPDDIQCEKEKYDIPISGAKACFSARPPGEHLF
jgi:hypothetical protein